MSAPLSIFFMDWALASHVEVKKQDLNNRLEAVETVPGFEGLGLDNNQLLGFPSSFIQVMVTLTSARQTLLLFRVIQEIMLQERFAFKQKVQNWGQRENFVYRPVVCEAVTSSPLSSISFY
ncbi:unnamed protein product [Ilex paraguariensis]|uniref:Uncharacterized protein n=1 Tax=Ilex paraguariensis TaxID=185542 RepID=A0ABC8R799_9AQUA